MKKALGKSLLNMKILHKYGPELFRIKKLFLDSVIMSRQIRQIPIDVYVPMFMLIVFVEFYMIDRLKLLIDQNESDRLPTG